eukprot:CAMPEP_0195520788 /NCGR_PEP_ID=MMETSP0794_2-20130614/17545_1 /TAXON_ID=515487 /ORGANISM="Stephanopyxis turris, Strain CCMP 815" /LENGTH=636 /DNA_ID=CAMNT_0040650211 /DNA_START=57 /DNA_END=1967 /DNA_ORIENTATION=+
MKYDANETTPLTTAARSPDGLTSSCEAEEAPTPIFAALSPEPTISVEEKARLFDQQRREADELSVALLALENIDGDEMAEEEVLRASLSLEPGVFVPSRNHRGNNRLSSSSLNSLLPKSQNSRLNFLFESMSVGLDQTDMDDQGSRRRGRGRGIIFSDAEVASMNKLVVMGVLSAIVVVAIVGVIGFGEITAIAFPNVQPVGEYKITEMHEGNAFFDFYNVYEGKDSAGSNGFQLYANINYAKSIGIVKVADASAELGIRMAAVRDVGDDADDENTAETTAMEGMANHAGRKLQGDGADVKGQKDVTEDSINNNGSDNGGTDETISMITIDGDTDPKEEFVYLGTAPTTDGPRDSIRLEGKTRWSRGLFIIDVRHMPAGCGTWPAFWLTDENNWPVNGEIDIVEGVNYQSEAKTALHTTKVCSMESVTEEDMTGGWDTAVGIPDAKTGIPDMTMRYAKDCFVYNKHQWVNQGCVAMDKQEGAIGIPLNQKGGGVYVLEWDPINRHIRSWVFTPHQEMPENLSEALRQAGMKDLDEDDKIRPNPDLWPKPYGYFKIGEGTDCPSKHFKNMRLVINTAFCGSVSGNRYFMDCPKQFQEYPTCNQYVQSNPKELAEAYWKIKGVYVYQRAWVPEDTETD